MSYIADYAPLLMKRYYNQNRRRSRERGFRRWENPLAFCLLIISVLSGIATYAALTETPPFGNNPDTVVWLLNADIIILSMLVVLIARRIVSLWSGRKRGIAGSHLHVRLVYTFSILAAVPVIIMTVFSAFFFHFGVQAWFSQRVQTAVNESQAVAEAYLEEHKQNIKADTLATAQDLNYQSPVLSENFSALEKALQKQLFVRNLSEAIVFDTSGRVLARSGLTFALEFESIPQFAMAQADEGDVVIMTGGNDDRVRALVKLNNYIGTYLFVGRMIDPQVLSHLASTKEASEDYADLQARYSKLQITVTMIFVLVGFLILMAAIWLGLILARQLVNPIITLITTADRVRAGDLAARVPEQDTLEEFDYLARSFNRMTKQIQEQQNELIQANRQLDRRRRFTETILAGVSSGIIGVDSNDEINLANSSALKLLGYQEDKLVGVRIADVVPEVTSLLEQAHGRPAKISQAEIPYKGTGEQRRTFLVRVAIEMVGSDDVGAILTFDDITELQAAQRKAAWADVARRIAHEIKNPLTPIQLSAERLRRKYLSQIHEDPETFSQCTDTIIRHVGDIGRMVNEFSSFARMPEPIMKQENLARQVKETLSLLRQAHTDITFNMIGFDGPEYLVKCDSQQIRQSLTNLLQNAVDSIHARVQRDEQNHNRAEPGQIDILLTVVKEHNIAIVVTDNGLGLPKNESPLSLTEPYVTHKPKGTGLGLAIVKKIMEDHNGTLLLEIPSWIKTSEGWRDLGGATVILTLPLDQD